MRRRGGGGGGVYLRLRERAVIIDAGCADELLEALDRRLVLPRGLGLQTDQAEVNDEGQRGIEQGEGEGEEVLVRGESGAVHAHN